MRITCPTCEKTYQIPDERLPMGKKVSFPCPNCQGKIKIDLRVEPPDDLDIPLPPEPAAPSRETPVVDGEKLKEKILRTLKDLPAMPQVVLKSREIMADANSGIKDVVKVLETDQAITTKILKVSNSAYYGMSGKISTIQHASMVLGYKTIGELITLAATSSLLDRNLSGYRLGSGALWRHSLSVAIGSRIIAQKGHPELAETSFSAGLIHDAGKLVLDKYVHERKEIFDEAMEHGRITYMEAEDRIFGFNHAEMGYDVCAHWKIPEDISLAIKHHHSPSRSNKNELAYIVHLADTIVNMADALASMGGMGAGLDALMYMLDDNSMAFLGIQEKDVQPIMAGIEKSVAEMSGSMA